MRHRWIALALAALCGAAGCDFHWPWEDGPPTAPSSPPAQPPAPTRPLVRSAPITVHIAVDGALTVDGEPVDEPDLTRHLTRRRRGDPHPTLTIAADANVPYERVIAILDAAHAAGIDEITITR